MIRENSDVSDVSDLSDISDVSDDTSAQQEDICRPDVLSKNHHVLSSSSFAVSS